VNQDTVELVHDEAAIWKSGVEHTGQQHLKKGPDKVFERDLLPLLGRIVRDDQKDRKKAASEVNMLASDDRRLASMSVAKVPLDEISLYIIDEDDKLDMNTLSQHMRKVLNALRKVVSPTVFSDGMTRLLDQSNSSPRASIVGSTVTKMLDVIAQTAHREEGEDAIFNDIMPKLATLLYSTSAEMQKAAAQALMMKAASGELDSMESMVTPVQQLGVKYTRGSEKDMAGAEQEFMTLFQQLMSQMPHGGRLLTGLQTISKSIQKQQKQEGFEGLQLSPNSLKQLSMAVQQVVAVAEKEIADGTVEEATHVEHHHPEFPLSLVSLVTYMHDTMGKIATENHAKGDMAAFPRLS